MVVFLVFLTAMAIICALRKKFNKTMVKGNLAKNSILVESLEEESSFNRRDSLASDLFTESRTYEEDYNEGYFNADDSDLLSSVLNGF